MENLRRLVIMRQDHRATGLLQFIDRLGGGRRERRLDRRDHILDPLIKMGGRAFDLGRPFQRWRWQRPRALGWADAGARWRGGARVHRVPKIVGTVDSSDRHGGLLPIYSL